LGLFTGIAAFFAGFMNWNFIMAGAASTNGMLFFVSVLIILAWKVAGYIGLDYFLLPSLGTPWHNKEPEPTLALQG
jgi:thiosulfate dehydrogenase [quinone] large subunit